MSKLESSGNEENQGTESASTETLAEMQQSESVEKKIDEKVKKPRVRKPKPATELDQEELLRSSIAFQKIMEEKPDGTESFSSTPVADIAPTHRHQEKSWWKKAMVLLGFGGVMASAHAGETKATSDTAKSAYPITKEATVSKPNESSPIVLDQKKLERAGIVRIDAVESTDTTKQVYLISLKEYKSYDDILKAIKKAGFELSSAETMIDVARRNGEMTKKSRYLMSLKYVTNKLGNMSAPTVTYDGVRGALHPEARELSVGIDSDEEQYRFVVEMPLPKNTARYEDGLAKK